MKFLLSTAVLLAPVFSQSAPIVQPGAPGQASQTLSSAQLAPREPTEADVQFMQGMIHHHAQAIEMTALLKARGRDKDLQKLGRRMTISQSDEIQFMSQWLEDHGKAVPMSHDHMEHTREVKMRPGMKMMDMGSMPPMPGMLSPEQMDALRKASSREMDRQFLTGMIQHHKGALVMVEDLFNTAGAGQDYILYDFATDVDNTQRAEIGIMETMLKEIK